MARGKPRKRVDPNELRRKLDEYEASIAKFAAEHPLALAKVKAIRLKKIEIAGKVQSPEFGRALDLAHWAGFMRPLADYIASEKPLNRHDRGALAGFILSLQKTPRGRPPASSNRSKEDEKKKARDALHNALWLVRIDQQKYRTEHHRQRVPREETERFITKAIGIAYEECGVRVAHINLRRLVYNSSQADEYE